MLVSLADGGYRPESELCDSDDLMSTTGQMRLLEFPLADLNHGSGQPQKLTQSRSGMLEAKCSCNIIHKGFARFRQPTHMVLAEELKYILTVLI